MKTPGKIREFFLEVVIVVAHCCGLWYRVRTVGDNLEKFKILRKVWENQGKSGKCFYSPEKSMFS